MKRSLLALRTRIVGKALLLVCFERASAVTEAVTPCIKVVLEILMIAVLGLAYGAVTALFVVGAKHIHVSVATSLCFLGVLALLLLTGFLWGHIKGTRPETPLCIFCSNAAMVLGAGALMVEQYENMESALLFWSTLVTTLISYALSILAATD